VLYVCSTYSIAAQNKKKPFGMVPVESGTSVNRVDRLTLLPEHNGNGTRSTLYTLTPDTSLSDGGNRRRSGINKKTSFDFIAFVKKTWPVFFTRGALGISGKRKRRVDGENSSRKNLSL